jgi:hypothetical protein
MKSFPGVPIVSKGKVFGNSPTEKRGAEELSQNDQDIADVGAQAAIAIENASSTRSSTVVHRARAAPPCCSGKTVSAGWPGWPMTITHRTTRRFRRGPQRRAEAETLAGRVHFSLLGMIQGRWIGPPDYPRLLDFARQRDVLERSIWTGSSRSRSPLWSGRPPWRTNGLSSVPSLSRSS